MGELATQTDHPIGSRQLGVRVKPVIRLGMGERTEQGYPRMLGHFTVRGDDQAVAAFMAEYPGEPRAVDIVLPATLDQALRIEYLAFKGGAENGQMVARGQTNFALRDYAGGPDLLTVWNKDGSVVEVETAGLDAMSRQPADQIAADLGLELQTTLRAMIPAVLPFGSFFEISTKGKESTDNLWFKLRQLYGFFGGAVSFAVRPQLILRESTMRPIVGEREERRRIKKQVWVLDILSRETLDEMFARLDERGVALNRLSAGEQHALPAPAGIAEEGSPSRLSSEDAAVGGDHDPVAADGRSEQRADEQPRGDEAAEEARLANEELRLAVEVAVSYEHAPPPIVFQGDNGEEEIDVSGTENPWLAYCDAYVQHIFRVDKRQMTTEQKRQLATHLRGLDEIPF